MKKKLLAIIFAIALIVSVCPFGMFTLTSSAETVSGSCGDNLTWEYDTSTQTLTISGTGEMSNYTGSFYDGTYYVTTAPWRNYYKTMKTLVINNGVTLIGDDAFSGCKGLTSITIPNSVTWICEEAFDSCAGLTSITIPNSVTWIGKRAFCCCTGLTSITIPDSVTTIDDFAFHTCTGLTSVTIGNSVESIGIGAFQYCNRLTSIEIPDSVTYIGSVAFLWCYSSESITVEEGNPRYHSSGNCLIETKSKTLILGCKNSVIPFDGSVTSIFGSAFMDCVRLTSIEIPSSVTSIGSHAFSGCTGLTSIEIPASVTKIGTGAFEECGGLESITVEQGNTKYHSSGNCLIEKESKTLFSGCKNSVIPLDVSVTSIGDYAFRGCTGLTSITIPDSVTSIGEWAFYECTGLTSITIPNSVTKIYNYAFYDCSGLTSVTIPDSVTWIGDDAFGYCTGLTSITIPDSVTWIGSNAFSGCKGLKSVTIGNSVESIYDGAFQYCKRLTSITIPNSVTEIDNYAFSDCTNLKDVYYIGTKQQRAKISIDNYNDCLINANWHYISHPIEMFPDIVFNSWYGDSVAYAVGSGLMKGYSNGKFGTADGIQRQDFVIILSRLSGDDIDSYAGKANFKDAGKGGYFAPALAWAKATGVSTGYNDGSFGVGRKVTREQIMAFLYRYAQLKGYDITVTDAEKAQIRAQYSDFKNVSSYAQEATYWALSRGVITGRESGGKKYIAPQANAQRCEVAKMFYNIDQNGIFAE